MELQTHAVPETQYRIHGSELSADRRLLLELLNRFEYDESAQAGCELMRVVVDLFRVHCAIERQVQTTNDPDLDWECEAMHERMEAVESAFSQGLLHFVGVIELKRTLDRYFATKEALSGTPSLFSLPATRSNRALLHDRNDLIAYAQHLLRLH